MKIVADDRIPYLKGALENFATMLYKPGADINSEDLKDADALIIRTRTKVNEALLANSKVKLVMTATIGYDHIDTEFLAKAGIKWLNCPGCNAGSVATYLASIIAHRMQSEAYKPEGKTFGIIGHGNVGKRVELVARSFGMNVLITDPLLAALNKASNYQSLDKVLENSDFITIHVPYTESGEHATAYMINEKSLSKMKKGAYIINSSRGGIIQEDDLKKELKNKRLKAVLDVWENEPNIDLELMQLCELATSHIAGYSVDGKANGTTRSVNHIAEDFGLDLHNWSAENLPKSDLVIEVEEGANGLIKAVKEVYDINDDNNNLKNDPNSFEHLRGTYKPRRDLREIKFVGDEINSQKLSKAMS